MFNVNFIPLPFVGTMYSAVSEEVTLDLFPYSFENQLLQIVSALFILIFCFEAILKQGFFFVGLFLVETFFFLPTFRFCANDCGTLYFQPIAAKLMFKSQTGINILEEVTVYWCVFPMEKVQGVYSL